MLQLLEASSVAHLQQIRVLFSEYAARLGFELDFQNFEQEFATLPGPYASPDGCLLLALHSGQLAGCVAMRRWRERTCEMKRLYVRPPFRRHGVGKALAMAIIEVARQCGYTHMRLDTVPSMAAARALYTALGFKPIPPYRHNPIAGAVYMELEL